MGMELVRGTKEYTPEEQEEREELLLRLIEVFKLYGYKPLETPILQKLETLTAKYGGGEEIVKEIFKLKDLGGRDLGLRFDLTVPLARFISARPNLRMPFKRYEYGKVFRNGPVKTGRLREFIQCDVDIVGSSSLLAEVELLMLAGEFFKSIGLDIEILLNDIRLLKSIVRSIGIKDEEQITSIILTIDKLEKIGREGVLKELVEKGLEKSEAEKLLELCSKTVEKLESELDEEGRNALNDLKRIKELCPGNIKITPSLARGLSYYTGPIFEIYTVDKRYRNAISAGGRYDNMIGMYSKKKEVIPAVGISFGIDSIIAALKILGIKKEKERRGVFIKPITGFEEKAIETARAIRSKGIPCSIDLSNKSLKASLRYADSEDYRYVIIIGKEEANSGLLTIKDLEKGIEEKKRIEVFLGLQ